MPKLTRRALLSQAAAAAVSVPRGRAFAQGAAPFQLAPLPYPAKALEPHIDAETIELHHDRHHGAAVSALNAAVKDYPAVAAMRLEQLLFRLGELPEAIRNAVRNNAGSHANHTMFWQVMGPPGTAPEPELSAAIERDFGGLAKLQEEFNAAGLRIFGSGWVFVTADADGKLAIVTKPNQDTPLMEGRRALVGNDVWEHAYYLTYQNRRADYLKAWWNVVNWTAVGARYAAAKDGNLGI
ncbi:superoxide dismutase [Bradyrhizobium uaiense]|uniref:Superoxide dismutase n=1 Tax=Bradyrhizobium uaiense TaxID=2594946 RepID=A0A6P1B8D4_9BRAD|nr:superoxide dismutase [Bradyrhizobium uaiense]NEU94689.1 superoxide dismutase [Bradyrhizobium uaiense]